MSYFTPIIGFCKGTNRSNIRINLNNIIRETNSIIIGKERDLTKCDIHIKNIMAFNLRSKSLYRKLNVKSNKITEKILHHFNKIISTIKYIQEDIENNKEITNFSIIEMKKIRSITYELLRII